MSAPRIPATGDATASLRVQLDGAAIDLPPGATLDALLALRALEPTAVATAVNGEFVPRAQRAGRVLADGDAVHTFKPIVGG